MLRNMQAVRAHVENGRIVADEPVDLPDGTLLGVLPVDEIEEELSVEERAEIEQAIEEGYGDFERGDFEYAREFAARLVAKP
jgi:hypothetical protein